MASFSVRCIFRWDPRRDQVRKHLYEERITLNRVEFARSARSTRKGDAPLLAAHAER